MKAVLLALALLGPVQSLDQTARTFVQQRRTPAGTRMFQAVSDVGRPAIVVGTLLVIVLADRASGPATALRTLLALIPTNVVVEGLKRATNRPRPDGEHKRSNAAFPSSHAANAAAIAAVLSRRWRRLAPAFIALALVVGASRIYLDRHWLSDVVVGMAIGAASAWLVARYWRGRPHGTQDAGEEPSPGAPAREA